jgi:hypothetical protein
LKSQLLAATAFLLVALSLISSNTIFVSRVLAKDAGEKNNDDNDDNDDDKQVKDHCAEFLYWKCILVP